MILELKPYTTPEHQPFSLGDSPRKAMIIHGFPGTPAEVRTLAHQLYLLGWEVHAPLLPGFGVEIANLNQKTRHDWINSVLEQWTALQSDGMECMLVGYSMGAAVAIHAASVLPPDKMVLISPFWHTPGIFAVLVALARRLAPNLRLFKNADFNDPRIRDLFASILPETDLDDPSVQGYIRTQFKLPLAALEEVVRMGKSAYRLAKKIQVETLVLQGVNDPIVLPANTKRLVKLLGEEQVCYYEIQAGHDLLKVDSVQFAQLSSAVANFADDGCIPISLSTLNQFQYQPEQLLK